MGTAADFLIEIVRKQPGDISILALGPLTNLALAMQKDISFAQNLVRSASCLKFAEEEGVLGCGTEACST